MRNEKSRGVTVAAPDARLDQELRRDYLRLVERYAGLRLTEHQARHLDGLVRQLVAASSYAGPRELYLALVAGVRRDLLDDLAAHLTIGETHFFRVGPQIDALRTAVLPDIVTRSSHRRQLRAWSAGCSTGEESYTLAILIREHLLAPDAWDVQLLATDINQPALEVARRATYGGWSFRGTPDDVRRRYFAPDGGRWRLVESVRRMVRFAHLNLLADPAVVRQPGNDLPALTSQLDLILCRNVTIYFAPDAAQRVYARFAEILMGGGWLVLGPSDPTPAPSIALEPVYLPDAVLWRRPTTTSVRRVAPTLPIDRQTAPPAAPATPDVPMPPQPLPRATTPGTPERLPSVPTSDASPGADAPAVDPERSRALLHGGDRVAAREQAERRIRARPLDGAGYLLLGLLQLDAGETEDALESLRRAAFLDADSALTQFSLGRAFARLGDGSRALRALAQARRLLADADDQDRVEHGGGMLIGELRHAVATLDRARGL